MRSSYKLKKVFAIHGGGKIGLGLMADILSRDKNDFEVVSISNNIFLNYLINHTPYFNLQHGPLANNNVTKVKSITMLPRDSETVVQLYKNADIVAICLTSEVLKEVAVDVAQGLIARYQENNVSLKIMIMMNKPQSEKFVLEAIRREMVVTFKLSIKAINSILFNVEFIPAVVDRIVTEINVETIKEQLRKQLKLITPKKYYWFIEKDQSYSEQIEDILSDQERLAAAIVTFKLQYNILNVEEEFNLFVPSSFLEARQFPSIKRVKNIDLLEAIKNKYINGPHAILAWAGALLGCSTIAEAIKYPGSAQFIKDLMEREICPILIAEYPDITERELDFLKKSFFARCEQSVDDPVTRVARDPLRKLNTGERIRGTIELRKKHKLPVSTSRLEYGIAAGILYAVKGNDPTNPNCRKIVDIYNKSNGSYKTVLCYKDLKDGTYFGLDADYDKVLVKNIIHKIRQLEVFCEKRKIHQYSQTSSQLILSKTTLNAPLMTMPRNPMLPKEKSLLQSLAIQQYSGAHLLHDPVKLYLPHFKLRKKQSLIYVTNEFAKNSFKLFSRTQTSIMKTKKKAHTEKRLLPYHATHY